MSDVVEGPGGSQVVFFRRRFKGVLGQKKVGERSYKIPPAPPATNI
jgi:hypothetical protein